MALEVKEVKGKRFVLVPEAEYRRLRRLAAGSAGEAGELPSLPQANTRGNYPALEYIRASIARDIIQERQALGLTQQEADQRKSPLTTGVISGLVAYPHGDSNPGLLAENQEPSRCRHLASQQVTASDYAACTAA